MLFLIVSRQYGLCVRACATSANVGATSSAFFLNAMWDESSLSFLEVQIDVLA